MKVLHHIDAQKSGWYRCSRVIVRDETVVWELNPSGRYEFLSAYVEKPHRKLIEATDDALLREFVKKWGPLRLRLDDWSGRDSLAMYRRERDLFRAFALLFAAVQKGQGLREAASGLVSLDSAPWDVWIRSRLGIPGALNSPLDSASSDRISSTTDLEILDLCRFLVGTFVVPMPSLDIQSVRKRLVLRPNLGTYTLIDALRWMVWQDIWLESPIQFCDECHRIIEHTSKHTRRYCGEKCAKRVAARNWRRKDLANKRLARQNSRTERNSNGANKTR